MLDLVRINKFVNKLETVSTKGDLSKLPEVEGYKWELENSKISLVKYEEYSILETNKLNYYV
jgi:hypothetical protein